MQTVIRLFPMFISGIACNFFVGLMASRVPVVFLVGAYSKSLPFLSFTDISWILYHK